MQNFSMKGVPVTMADGSVATSYLYNSELPNGATVSVSTNYS